MDRVFEKAAAGTLRPKIDSVFPFERTYEAHERLHSRQSIGKVVVTVP